MPHKRLGNLRQRKAGGFRKQTEGGFSLDGLIAKAKGFKAKVDEARPGKIIPKPDPASTLNTAGLPAISRSSTLTKDRFKNISVDF